MKEVQADLFRYARTPEEQRLVQEEYKRRNFKCYREPLSETIGFCNIKGGDYYYWFDSVSENVVINGDYESEVKIEDFVKGYKMAFQIATPTPEISEAVQKYLFSKGYIWADGVKNIQHTSSKYLQIGLGTKHYITQTATEPWDCKIISLHEVPDVSLEINGHKVTFENGVMKFDTFEVPVSILRDIYNEFKKKPEFKKGQIATPTPAINEAVQKYLFTLGYRWVRGSQEVINTNAKYITFGVFADGILGYNHTPFQPDKFPILSLHELLKSSFTISDHVVIFNKDSITVGCQTFTSEHIEQIYDKIR